MIKRHRNYKCLFLVTICILLISVAGLSACATPAPAPTPGQTPQSTPPPPSVQPPDPPSNLVGEPVSQSIVSLQWSDNSDNEDGFRVYRDGSVVATASANSATYQDRGLQAGKTYQYAVRAYLL